jgi:hypothetical protein
MSLNKTQKSAVSDPGTDTEQPKMGNLLCTLSNKPGNTTLKAVCKYCDTVYEYDYNPRSQLHLYL